ncbi:MAG: phosphatase PAP2 family protein [Spirochaetes bacterium]|nr:phosphatase PAP2 family protein [Spirochaetota bacterium]
MLFLDKTITTFFQYDNSFLLRLSTFFDFLGSSTGYILLLLIILFYIDYRLALNLAIILSFSFIINSILKLTFRLPRPFETDQTVKNYLRINRFIGYGMPSGHAQTASSLFFELTKLIKYKIIIILLALLVLCIGLSRIYLGLHWPSQVLAGFTMGYFAIKIIDRFKTSQFFTQFLSMSCEYKITATTVFALLITLGGLTNMMILGDASSSLSIFAKGKELFSGCALLSGSACGGFLLRNKFSIRYNRYLFSGSLRFITGSSILLLTFIPLLLLIKKLSVNNATNSITAISLLYAYFFTTYIFAFSAFYFIQHFFNRLGLVFLEPKGTQHNEA